MNHITNEQLAVMLEENNTNTKKVMVALYGDKEIDEQGLIKDVKELKDIVTTSRTLWDAIKIIGKYIIGLSVFVTAVMYLRGLFGNLSTK